jgi:hypothetical protein
MAHFFDVVLFGSHPHSPSHGRPSTFLTDLLVFLLSVGSYRYSLLMQADEKGGSEPA